MAQQVKNYFDNQMEFYKENGVEMGILPASCLYKPLKEEDKPEKPVKEVRLTEQQMHKSLYLTLRYVCKGAAVE